MFPILQIGPVALQVPGLLLLAGLWTGLSIAEREAARLKLNPDAVYNLSFIGLAAGLVGARLAYAARYIGAYAADPASLLSFNAGTLAQTEGVLIGVLAAVLYGARRKLPFRATLDALAPAAAVMGIAFGAAHLASGDAFGAPARLPWSVYLWDEYRHPSQVYEILGALAVFAAWRWLRMPSAPAGTSMLLVIALSAASRIFLEAFRGDSVLTVGGLRAAQVWGLVIMAAALGGMRFWSRAE